MSEPNYQNCRGGQANTAREVAGTGWAMLFLAAALFGVAVWEVAFNV